MKLNYVQLPILRIIDFINKQFMPVFDKKIPFEQISKKIIQQNLDDPLFPDINVTLLNPKILLKTDLETNESIEVNLGKITVTNR